MAFEKRKVNERQVGGEFEKTKQFQLTLQPSVREKISRLAKENGYRSASSYVNDHFKNL